MLAKEFAVRTQTNKLQYFSARLAVNQQQVGLKVAFAMVSPFACQRMIAVLIWQRLVFS